MQVAHIHTEARHLHIKSINIKKNTVWLTLSFLMYPKCIASVA